jgi:formylglycine-generating enzyme required for sulfatase activity
LQYAFPGLFGLLLGYVVLGDWARALFVAAVAGPVFFNVAVPLGSKYYFIPAGVAGALLMTVALVLWRRQLFGIGLLLRAALIGAVGGYLFGLLGGGIWSYMAWQVMVGCVVADYGFQAAPDRGSGWSLAFKPVIAIGAASLLIGVAGISANAMRETQASDTYPGTTETNPLDGLAYHWIPKGEFQMGCSPDDNQCYGDESPSHRITITNGFWLGGTEVTTAAYRKVVASMPPAAIFLERDLNPSWSDDQLPITNVTWVEAGSYCASVDGRLPTEAEWEYAARAGTTGASYGRLDEIAWYANNSGDQRVDGEAVWLASGEDNNEFSRRLAANGNRIRAASQLYVNAWGLVDMLGNAAEWVQDDYGDQLYGTRSGATTADPSHSTGTSSSEKIRRGGSWYNRSRSLRASFRANTAADDRSVIAGFRCVWDKAATDARNASGE